MSAFEALFYALGAVLYALHFLRRQPAVGRAATAALSAGVIAHTFLMGMATVREGALPLSVPLVVDIKVGDDWESMTPLTRADEIAAEADELPLESPIAPLAS